VVDRYKTIKILLSIMKSRTLAGRGLSIRSQS
jgi:hypothetical protein